MDTSQHVSLAQQEQQQQQQDLLPDLEAAAQALRSAALASATNKQQQLVQTACEQTGVAAGCTTADVAVALHVFASILQLRMQVCELPLEAAIGTQVLLLTGGKGTCTHGHIDPAGAVTWAWGLGPEPLVEAQVLAYWLFVSPTVFQDLALLVVLLQALRAAKAGPQPDAHSGSALCRICSIAG